MKKMQSLPFAGLGLFAILIAFVVVTRGGPLDWRNASREPVGLAPDPAATPEAIVQVYAARTWGWRGYFGVHTWIAVKPARAKTYTVYEVIGWRLRREDSVLAVRDRIPDERWFGSMPVLLVDKRGTGADALVGRIDKAARAYPYSAEVPAVARPEFEHLYCLDRPRGTRARNGPAADGDRQGLPR